MRLKLLVLLTVSLRLSVAFPTHEDVEKSHEEVDGETSRRIIGQSVVTSVSVIMNGDSKPQFTDAVGKTVPRPRVPPKVASPINLLNPDRYEFYTFDDNGDLVKRLMTLKEIQSIVANGNGAAIGDNEPGESQSVLLNSIPLSNPGAETKVQDIVDNVQSVLSREMENNKNLSHIPPQLLDTPDVSSSWSMILPAIFGNTGDEILPHKPIYMTPETEIVDGYDTTTMKLKPNRKSTTKAAVKASPKPAPAKATIVPMTVKNQPTISSTKKQTTRAKPKPKPSVTTTTTATTSTTTTTTTPKPRITTTTEAIPETTTTIEIARTAAPTTTTQPPVSKTTPLKKITKKPTPSPAKKNSTSIPRPMTNSPIVIERIEKKPLLVESKTEGGIDLEMFATTNLAPTTTTSKVISFVVTNSEATTTQKPTTKHVPQTTMIDRTTLSASEEDRQDSAISQIIGSLQSDLFKPFEKATTEPPMFDETTIDQSALVKVGNLNLTPDKVLMNDQLFIDETEPIVKNLPTTTELPIAFDVTTVTDSTPIAEKLEATTMKVKSDSNLLGNSEVMQTIEKLIQEQVNAKTKLSPEKLDVLGFDDDDDTEIRVHDMLENQKNLTQSEYITKAATMASILNTKTFEASTTTTTEAPASEESDTTVPTILSDALNNVIQLMLKSQEEKKTTTVRPDEPTELDLNKLLQHYEGLNSHLDREKLESLSMITSKSTEAPPSSVETMVVKETSSISMKNSATTQQPEVTPTESVTEENIKFTTFFFVDNNDHSETTEDSLGDFTTEQYVATEKRVSDRKEEESVATTASVFTTTTVSTLLESEEESNELVSEILNEIGIASDEEDDSSTEKLKNDGVSDSVESDEVENAIASLTSTLDKTLTTDVKTDIKLTSKIASSLISVAHTISDTLGDDDESEEIAVVVQTTSPGASKQEATTLKVTTVTEKSEDDIVDTTEMVQDATEMLQDATEMAEADLEENFTTEADIPITERSELTEAETEQDETATENVFTTTTESEIRPKKPFKNINGQMVQLSVIRKDNSLEEIDFITPPTHTSTKIPITLGNFVKIENILENFSTTTPAPKLSGFKNKGQEVSEHIKPIYIQLRSTTTAKSSELPEADPSQTTFKVEEMSKLEDVLTERVPLIEFTRTTQSPKLSTTDENLVEIKVQTKPTTEPFSTTPNSFSNAQAIKNSIKNAQHPSPRPLSPPIDLSAAPEEALGLAASTADLSTDLSEFSKLCNELAFTFWKSITADGISQSRSVVISPFALTSTLSMIFLGARGQTSGEMNDLLRLDDMVTFNPHVIFRNISESIENSRKSGIAAAAFARELYSDRSKGKLLPYFKEKAQQFYGAHVEEVNFNVINDILRRRTNLLVKRHTQSKINEYLKTNNIWVNEPLAAVSANVFLTDCSRASNNERDGEMFFQVSPAIRQRRLIPIPAAVYRSGFTAGYDPILDATAVAFGDDLHSTIMVMPGQQGSSIPGDNLDRLENAFMDASTDSWNRLLTTFMERPGLEVQIPRFSHRSLINATFALQQMGLKDIFDAQKADLRGLTGAKSNDLYFSDMMQINQFSTCGEDTIGDQHHVEIYPSPSLKRDVNVEDEEEDGKLEITPSDNMQYKTLFYDPIYDSRYINVPLPLRPRQARLPENPRLRFDRPFLYFVRHNPTGIILFMGRFNPRLLP